MIAVLAEDKSDALAIKTLLKRIGVQMVKVKSYDGCGGMLRKGARDIQAWTRTGVTHFLICHDADRNSPSELRQKIVAKIVKPAKVEGNCCIVIPIQEIEAWVIADSQAIRRVIPSLEIQSPRNPESLNDPKEWLIDMSRRANARPLYVPAVHNPQVAQHLDFDAVQRSCGSFKEFVSCVHERVLASSA